MKVTGIQSSQSTNVDFAVYKNGENEPKPKVATTAKKETTESTAAWQKDILMQALDRLENSVQMDDSLPLNKVSAAPIESFEEAMIELSFVKSPFFKKDAAAAQANVDPQDVASLFSEK